MLSSLPLTIILKHIKWKLKIEKQKWRKNDLPELHNEFPFGLSKNHKASNENRITPKYSIEYLQIQKIKNKNLSHTKESEKERERERESTSDPSLKDRMAERTLTAMQRMAVRAVMTLKPLQTIKKGSGLVLSIVLLVLVWLLMALEDEDVLATLSPSPLRPIFFLSLFFSELS